MNCTMTTVHRYYRTTLTTATSGNTDKSYNSLLNHRNHQQDTQQETLNKKNKKNFPYCQYICFAPSKTNPFFLFWCKPLSKVIFMFLGKHLFKK